MRANPGITKLGGNDRRKKKERVIPSLSLVVRERVHVGLRKAESTRLPLKVPPCPGDKETYYE